MSGAVPGYAERKEAGFIRRGVSKKEGEREEQC